MKRRSIHLNAVFIAISVAVIGAFMGPVTVSAQWTILSNLPSNNGGSGGVSSETRRAVTFTTRATPLEVTQVSMQLHDYVAPADVAYLSINANGGSSPGQQIASLTAPTSTNSGFGTFTFTSIGIPLAANTTYWLVISAQGTSTAFEWARSDPSVTPPQTDYATFGEQWISYNSGETWAVGSNGAHSFSITAVPEPGILHLLVPAALVGLLLFRRSRLPRHS